MISFFLLFFPLQCNSTATRGVSKKARVQTPSSQTPLKVAQLLSLLVCLFVNLLAWRDVMSFLIVHFHQHCYSLAELKFIIIKILNNVHNSYIDLWYLYIYLLPICQVRKEKLGDRITALHQLVSPFGKVNYN